MSDENAKSGISVLIDSYVLVCQNASGGVKVRIENFVKNIKSKVSVKLFDKWSDRVTDYDLVHIFKSSSESYSMMKYAHSHGIPVVVSSVVPSTNLFAIKVCHFIGSIAPIYPDRYLNERVLVEADALCAQTEKEKRFIIKAFHIDPQKIHVIPNGISLQDTPIPENLFEELTGIKGDFLLQVGRFDSNKNQLNVIRALKDTDIQVVFVGGADKEEPEYYETCVSEANQNMHFLGWIDHNDPLLRAAYSAAHSVILPSFKEIFGNSLMEGGACGANLIVSDVLPVEEWGLDRFCKKIQASDTDKIRQTVLASMAEPKSDEISRYVRNTFSWDRVTDRYIEVYKSVLKTGKK